MTPAPGDPRHRTVFELVLRGRCALIVYRSIDSLPWTLDGKSMPRVSVARPNFRRLGGRIVFLGPYAIWLVRVIGKPSKYGQEGEVSINAVGGLALTTASREAAGLERGR